MMSCHQLDPAKLLAPPAPAALACVSFDLAALGTMLGFLLTSARR